MLHSNKAILDEAARSVRRTFIGSVAGSVGMLIVVGAAGAYGMPERFTAQALTVAMTKFNTTFPHAAALATAPAEQALQVAPQEIAAEATVPAAHLQRRPVAMPVAEGSIVRTLPPVEPPAAAVAAPVAPPEPPAPEPAPAPAQHEVAVMPAVPVVDPAPAIATVAPVIAPVPVTPDLPSPNAAASVVTIPAPLVFEQPKLADIKPLEALPKLEPIAVSPMPPKTEPSPVAVTDGKQSEQASAVEPPRVEFPQTAMLPMPLAKPPMTPAQRLDLHGKDYDKAERCLAQAIYFEARDQPARGQMAVAQVVLNRVFSPHYPKDICSVVYQNADHYLGCQFTFACDGKPESIREYGAWARANRLAREALAAKIWLPDVAKATHYHATYVRPAWVREMRVMVRYGIHTFYRPRNWGDGSNEPAWGAGAKKSAKS